MTWFLSLVSSGLCMFMVLKLLDYLWWRPKRLEHHFASQGIRGPPYRFFVGCVKEMVGLMLEASSKPMVPQTSHNILPRVLSFYHHWKKIYGTPSLLPPRISFSVSILLVLIGEFEISFSLFCLFWLSPLLHSNFPVLISFEYCPVLYILDRLVCARWQQLPS